MNSLVKESDAAVVRPVDLELTVLMPCLNEAETLGACIAKAQAFLARKGVAGEVVVADNGSTDESQEIARQTGARVVNVPIRGYGAALLGGLKLLAAATSSWATPTIAMISRASMRTLTSCAPERTW
jgi:cellulose synthase/poly-beta-1,6-N-acetylglucosamine synthase-like glycosyltransferase